MYRSNVCGPAMISIAASARKDPPAVLAHDGGHLVGVFLVDDGIGDVRRAIQDAAIGRLLFGRLKCSLAVSPRVPGPWFPVRPRSVVHHWHDLTLLTRRVSNRLGWT